VTLEDPVALSDEVSVDKLQEGIETIVSDIKDKLDGVTLKYNLAGVGGDTKCVLQVVAHKSVATLEQVSTVRYVLILLHYVLQCFLPSFSCW
jgi:hypothetical protein